MYSRCRRDEAREMPEATDAASLSPFAYSSGRGRPLALTHSRPRNSSTFKSCSAFKTLQVCSALMSSSASRPSAALPVAISHVSLRILSSSASRAARASISRLVRASQPSSSPSSPSSIIASFSVLRFFSISLRAAKKKYLMPRLSRYRPHEARTWNGSRSALLNRMTLPFHAPTCFTYSSSASHLYKSGLRASTTCTTTSLFSTTRHSCLQNSMFFSKGVM
mmetsp:Transcript_45697/g.111259  ORF Transcript_45697/g.111259 Transcript_45697/m.111259 type:complete len:222 (+) Transcript_45697:994-1659(+)